MVYRIIKKTDSRNYTNLVLYKGCKNSLETRLKKYKVSKDKEN